MNDIQWMDSIINIYIYIYDIYILYLELCSLRFASFM